LIPSTTYKKQECVHLKKKEIYKTKRQPTEWRNMFVSPISYNILVSRKCKELLQLSSKTINNSIFKMSKKSEQTFLQRKYTNGQ
jgi:hypothetical protein